MNLLTGATGFVGGHVVEYLFQQSEISKGTFRMGSHLKILDLNGVQGIEVDLLDHHSLHEAVEGTDTVYSMASPMPGADTDFERVNTEGISNLLEVAQEMGVKTIVHLSTLDVYGFGAGRIDGQTPLKPAGPYQTSKAAADGALIEFSKRNPLPRIVIIRAARAVGSRDQTLVVPVLKMIEAGKVVLPGKSEMSFTHPRDVAQAMYKAASNPSLAAGVYLTKSFDATAASLASQLAKAVGVSAEVRRPGFMSKGGLPPYTADQMDASLRIDAQPGWKEMGYSPEFDLSKTCEEIAAWYKKEPWVTEPA